MALLHKRRQRGAAPYPHQAAFLLNNPVRRALSNPAPKVDSIGLTGSERVLEVGPEKARRQLELAGVRPFAGQCAEAGRPTCLG
jgi:hypothetical protein